MQKLPRRIDDQAAPVCDSRGPPLGMMISGGNVNDTTMMTVVLEDIRVPSAGKGRPRTRPDRVLADKGYPSRANRSRLRTRGIAATPRVHARAGEVLCVDDPDQRDARGRSAGVGLRSGGDHWAATRKGLCP